MRWTSPEQWHVTLAFMGDVAETDVEAMKAALVQAAAGVACPPVALLGPASVRFAPGVLGVPVTGLEGAARAVRDALAPFSAVAPDARPFRGHLTLARARGRRSLPRGVEGAPLRCHWTARELCLVQASLHPTGASYTTLARATIPTTNMRSPLE